MPFFYSQYLKDDKKAWAAREVSQKIDIHQQPPKASSITNNNKQPTNKLISKQQSFKKRPQQVQQRSSPQRPEPASSTPSRLVWHSNVGSSLKTGTPNNKHAAKRAGGGFFSAFQYNDPTKKKTVHFATIEVQPYNWDYSCDKDVYYRKDQITAMNKQRFTDASKLRKQRNIKVPSSKDKKGGDKENKKACDDVDISKRASDITTLLNEAFDAERDVDEQVSIRGIEHFVYPELQQEMIRRKKHAKREVLNFKKAKRPDPQGWRLAKLSEANTQWARDVAIEKGMRYCMNQEAIYGTDTCGISRDELERSKDELDNLHMLKSSASCVGVESSSNSVVLDRRNSRLTSSLAGSKEEVSDITTLMSNVKMAYSEDTQESRETSQSAGADTRED